MALLTPLCASAGSPTVPRGPVPLQAAIITEAMDACDIFVVLATRSYGATGTSVIDTRKELTYAMVRAGKGGGYFTLFTLL